jgi:hypothetical protein
MENPRETHQPTDKGRIGSYTKLCDFTLLFMILQVELQLNKESLVRPRLVDQVKACTSIMTICEHYRDLCVVSGLNYVSSKVPINPPQ